ELWIEGPHVAHAYWDNPAVSAASLHARIDGEKGEWLRSGDLGFLDAKGQLFITGRIKDLIIIRGANHYPQDIELTVQRAHPALTSNGGAVFSVPDERGEEQLVVVQEVERTARNRIDADEIAGVIREAVTEQHEVFARHIVLIRPQSLPKTTSGKVQRSLAKRLWIGGKLDYLTAETAAEPNRERRGSCSALSHKGRGQKWQRLEFHPRLLALPNTFRDPLLHAAGDRRAVVAEVHEVGAVAGEWIVDAEVDEIAMRPAGDDL